MPYHCIYLLLPTIMSGASSHLPDIFLDNSYSIPYNNIPYISHPDFNVLSHTHTSDISCTFFHEICLYWCKLQSLSLHSTSTFSIIASVSHDALIQSGNAAYALVNMLYLEAKCKLQAQRYVLAYSLYMRIQLIVSLPESLLHSCRM